MAKVIPKRGDVFLIPLDDTRVSLGQVVDVLPNELYLVAFGGSWQALSPPLVNEVLGKEPRFSTLSLDAKLWNGDWPIIGNTTENLPNIRLPLFKVRSSGCVLVEKHDGSKSRIATSNEELLLRFRATVSPIRLENAVKADQGIKDWNTAFDELFYSYAKESSQLEV
jgi:hypothetical protein